MWVGAAAAGGNTAIVIESLWTSRPQWIIDMGWFSIEVRPSHGSQVALAIPA
jgi:hypothetical protein